LKTCQLFSFKNLAINIKKYTLNFIKSFSNDVESKIKAKLKHKFFSNQNKTWHKYSGIIIQPSK